MRQQIPRVLAVGKIVVWLDDVAIGAGLYSILTFEAVFRI